MREPIKKLNIVKPAIVFHVIASIGLPLLFIFASWLMCPPHDGDGCGWAIAFLSVPFLILIIAAVVVAIFLSIFSWNIPCIWVSVVPCISVISFILSIFLNLGGHLFFGIFLLGYIVYALATIVLLIWFLWSSKYLRKS